MAALLYNNGAELNATNIIDEVVMCYYSFFYPQSPNTLVCALLDTTSCARGAWGTQVHRIAGP